MFYLWFMLLILYVISWQMCQIFLFTWNSCLPRSQTYESNARLIIEFNATKSKYSVYCESLIKRSNKKTYIDCWMSKGAINIYILYTDSLFWNSLVDITKTNSCIFNIIVFFYIYVSSSSCNEINMTNVTIIHRTIQFCLLVYKVNFHVQLV